MLSKCQTSGLNHQFYARDGTGEIHLKQQCAPEGLLTGVGPKGEFHGIAQSASEVLLTGVTRTGEIHLETQCASEGIVEGVRL